ncbi:MAG: hypothetical protein AAF806_04070 [Bacteroidota bacterium]
MSNSNDKITLFHLLSATAAKNNDNKMASTTTDTEVLVEDAKPKIESTATPASTPNLPKFTAREEVVAESPASKEEVESLATAADFLADFEPTKTAIEPVDVAEEVATEEEPEMRLFASNVKTTQEEFLPTEEETAANLAEELSDSEMETPAQEMKHEVPTFPSQEEEISIATNKEEPIIPVANIPISVASEEEEAELAQEEESIIFDESEEEDTSLEFLDDPDNFDTEDIDEAYRKRLIALGLESIDPVEMDEPKATPELTVNSPEVSAQTIEETNKTEEVDDALSNVFANPPAARAAAPTNEPEATPETPVAPTREHFSPLDFKVDSEPNKPISRPSNIPNTAAAQATMLQQFRQLQDRNSTFVFMFGRQQAGKTVILSSLAYHMGTDEHGLLETRRRVDNLKGAAYLKQLSESVRKGQFMNRTSVGSLYELDLTYTPNKPEVPMNFTFLEMSGEDLTKVELSESSAGDLPSDIEVYLKCPNLNLIFMVVVPYEDAEEHDYLVIDFLDYLKERKPDFDYSKLLLLVSKWDRYEGARKDEVDLFVKEQMPRTYSRLKAKKATLARYSIGEVSDDNNEILELNMERPNVVKRWMYQAATGQKIKHEQSSFWNKMKRWM